MNLLEKFEKLNNKLTNLLEENRELKKNYKNLQEEYQELKEKLDENDYKNLQKVNRELKEKLEERNKLCQQYVINLKKQKNEQLELNLQRKNLQEENKNLKQKFNERLEENERFKRQCKNFQGENKNLKQKLNERSEENVRLKRQHKNFQEENQKLKKNLYEKENQFQQHIRNLEKQKNEELEIFSKNLEKTLEKLELDELNEVNDNDIKNFKEKTKPTTPPLIDDDIKDKEFIQPIEDPSGSVSFPSKDKSNQTPRSGYLHPENKLLRNCSDIRVVVGLDFGATYSGFTYCHVEDSASMVTNSTWPGMMGNLKTNTALQYDDEYKNVVLWGYPALAIRGSIELFKLHLSCNLEKPYLPKELCYQKAITDYLGKIGELIEDTIATNWDGMNFQNVLWVLTVPAEYSNNKIAIMRDCVFNAGLIEEKYSERLQFITEPEAAAIYCSNNIGRDATESNFMIVDCGGGTVDLTSRKLLDKKLSEITERVGDICGSTFIDKAFINFLRKKLGSGTIDILIEKYYGLFQYMIREFCENAKLPFTGDDLSFSYELDISDFSILLEYVSEETRYELEKDELLIKIDYHDIKAMFDPIIDRIIRLIHSQLFNAQETCSVMFLVGGFSQSKYLQKRVKQEFQHTVKNIYVPQNPIAAISHGAAMYGLSLIKNDDVISTRILKYTYGIEVVNYWMDGDPISRRLHNGRIVRFHCLARRGTQVETNQKVTTFFTPLSPLQTRVSFRIFFTNEYDAKYCDEPGMRLLGKLVVNLPGSDLLDRLLFGFTFGQMEFTVSVKNETNGQNYITKFKMETD